MLAIIFGRIQLDRQRCKNLRKISGLPGFGEQPTRGYNADIAKHALTARDGQSFLHSLRWAPVAPCNTTGRQ
jgi:hypothetical protein